MMKSLLCSGMLLLLSAAGFSAAPPALAAQDMTQAGSARHPGMTGAEANGRPGTMKRGMARGMNRRRGDRCAPMVHDIYWLDYSRMGMGMRGASDGGNRQQNASQGRMNRRMRILRLKHDGFPPRERGGCPSCRVRAGGMGRWRARADMASAMKKGGRRGAGRSAARPDPLLRKAAIWLETPDNLIHRIEPGKPGVMKFNARMWGQHKVFAYFDGGEKNGVRQKYFAFYDLFSHGDEVSKKERPVLNEGGYWKGRPEFHLERIYENSRQRYRTQTGEKARFRLTLRGKPVKDACVVMITQKDWRKAKKTDENGEVFFFLIKETPTEGGWRARRRSEKYLVAARYIQPGSGGNGARDHVIPTRYSATTVLRVRPSRLEWESKSTAFLVGSFTMIAAGAAIAVRRSRRRKRTKGAS